MARKISVELIGDSSSVERAFGRAGKAGQKFGMGIGQWVKGALIFKGVDLAVDALNKTIRTGVGEWKDQTEIAAQTANVLRSTGGIANVTAKHVDALANSILAKTGIDDEATKAAENMLLTFTNVRNEVGKGNDIFDQATVAALDMSTAMQKAGKSMSFSDAAVLLGKALNDPVKGMTALRRVGVALGEDQIKLVKSLIKSGDTMGAQKVILKELQREFGGAAKAAGETLPGKLRIMREQWNNMAGDLVGLAIPAFSRFVSVATDFTRKFSAAHGWRAKFSVVVDTGKEIEQKIAAAVQAVDWAAVWGKARGIAAGLKARFESIDWGATGQAIGDGIAAAVERAIQNTKGMPTAFLGMVDSIDWVKFGKKMGPGLAAALVTAFATLTDPMFWIKNWDLALAVGLTVFGGSIGKLAGRFAAPLVRVFGRMGVDAITAVVSAIDKLSPRIGTEFLIALMKLPGLAGRALAALEAFVSRFVTRIFGRLSGIAKFTIKVLGIQAAIGGIVSFAQAVGAWIQKVVDWFKGLPGRIIRAVGHPDLSDIGSAIISSLWDGMKSMWTDHVEPWLKSIGSKIKKLKGPKAKDATLLVEEGRAIMLSLGVGMKQGQQENERFLSGVAASIKKQMNEAARVVARLQAQMDAANRRREDRDNARALADAEKQLAAARKKGKNIADAERAVQDALERIHDTAAQRELDKAQKQYDKLQKAYESAQAKMEKAQQKAADRLRKLQDAAGAAFDKLAGKIQSAFDAKNGAWVAPAQQAIDAINDRRAQEDLQSAADDAQKAYEDALLGGDPAEIARKMRDRDRALEDITVAGLEKQAAAQTTAHDQWVAAQQEALDGMLENLRTKLTEQGTAWDDGLTGILGVISSYDGDFGSMGDLLGSAFTKSLMDSVYAAVDAAAAVAGVQSPVSDAKVQAQAQAALEAAQKAGKPAWQQALDARGAGMNAMYGGGVTKNYNLNVGTVVQRNADEIPQTLRNMERLAA